MDSLEADLILDEHSLEDSIQAVPEPIWPPFKTDPGVVEKDVNFVTQISFNRELEQRTPNGEPVGLLDVSRNGTFVRSIQFKSNNKISPLMGSSMLTKSRIPRMLESQLSPIGTVLNFDKLFLYSCPS